MPYLIIMLIEVIKFVAIDTKYHKIINALNNLARGASHAPERNA